MRRGANSQATDFSGVINWGDGSTSSAVFVATTAGNYNVEGSHTYAVFGGYTVSVSVQDNGGGSANASGTATVSNVAPSNLSLTATGPINENSSTSLSGSFSDPGSGDSHTLTISWGDGSPAQTVDLSAGVLNFSGITHQYLNNLPGNAPYTISVSVDDNGGLLTSNTTTVVVDDVAPTINLAQSATASNEGSVYTLDLGAITDPGTLDVVTSYFINWGDGSAVFNGSGSPANTTQTHTFEDGPSSPTISVTLVDQDGTHGNAGTISVDVVNVAPTAASFSNTGSISEGSSTTVIFTNPTDPSPVDTADGLHYAYDFRGVTDSHGNPIFADGAGDGTYAGSTNGSAVEGVPASFLTVPGLHTVYGRIIDKDGGFTDFSTTFMVANVPPIVNLIATASAGAGLPFTFSGSFTDPGTDGPWTGTVNYGDGTGTQVLTTINSTNKTFTLGHTYASAGNYTLTVEIDDHPMSLNGQPALPSASGTASSAVTVSATTLQVLSAVQTPDGFDFTFNRAIQASDLELYGPGSVVSPVSVKDGLATVNGSLVWDATTNTAHWIKTGGELAAGTYSVTLSSGTSGNNFHDASGGALDGNSDGTAGDAYSNTFHVTAPSEPVLSIPNFARGPGQSVIVNQGGTQLGSTGLPITISDGTGVQSVHFVLSYNPSLLNISTVLSSISKPANWSVTINSSTPGALDIVVFSNNASTLGSGPQTVLTFNNVSVPSNAPTKRSSGGAELQQRAAQ